VRAGVFRVARTILERQGCAKLDLAIFTAITIIKSFSPGGYIPSDGRGESRGLSACTQPQNANARGHRVSRWIQSVPCD
jgi:hypothetical protein